VAERSERDSTRDDGIDARRRFGDNVRRLRHQGGLSQERLAFACRLHRTEISLLERGERDARLSTIVRVARGLGVSPAALLAKIE
jgi:transcriptional regulator with XRE-family HTH domain